MTKDTLVSVIIANWNGIQYLEKCLSSVRNQTHPAIETIVVDNGSCDGSIEFIENNFPEIRIIKNRKNLGFTGANNIGIKASNGAYIATLNNDTVAEPDWIKNLIQSAIKRKNAGMFASKILSYGKVNLIESVGMSIYPDGLARCRGYLKENKERYNQEEEVLLPSACAALYRKEPLMAAGLFDEDYFAYSEDTDLGLRIRMLGFSCVYVPDARVYHYYSGTARFDLLRKVYLAERNRLWTIIKTFPISQLILSPLYTLMRYFFYIYAAILQINPAREFCKKGSAIKILFILSKVYVSTMLHLTGLIKKRLEIMRNKKVKNKEIIGWIKKYRIGLKEVAVYPGQAEDREDPFT